MHRLSTTLHSFTLVLGALACSIFAPLGCDDGSFVDTDDEDSETATGHLDTDDETPDLITGPDTTADLPGAHAIDPQDLAGRTPESNYGGCAECNACLMTCDSARTSCEGNADYWRARSEQNCWYAYGWVCWYVEPGNDQDGACLNYNSCMQSASMQHQWDYWACAGTQDSCREYGCTNDCLCH